MKLVSFRNEMVALFPAPGERFLVHALLPEEKRYPPVLLLHGLALDHRSFLPVARFLAAHGFPVYLYDQRGFGDSPPPRTPPSLHQYKEDLKGIVEGAVRARFHLLGHSFGGMVALLYAVEHPDSLYSLTLLSTTAHNGRRASRFARAMGDLCAAGYDTFVQDEERVKVVEGILEEAFPGMGVRLSWFRKAFPKPDPASAHAWWALANFSVKEQVLSLPLPLLVFHGTHDTWIPYPNGEWIGTRHPRARWIPLPGGKHFPHEEFPERFQEELLRFLEETSP